MATKINVEGRRLVKEAKIAEIGQGAEYTAGTGISITGTDTKTIAIDNTVVAVKSDLTDFATESEVATDIANATKTVLPVYDSTDVDFTDVEIVQVEGQNYLDISDVINALPILVTDSCTDLDTLPNTVKIGTDRNDEILKQYYLKGSAMIKDTANNKYVIITTYDTSKLQFGTALSGTLVTKLGARDGGDGHLFTKSKCKRWYYATALDLSAVAFRVNGVEVPFNNIMFCTLSGSNGDVAFNQTGIKFGRIQFEFKYTGPKSGTQTTYNNGLKLTSLQQGNYQLEARVGADNGLTEFKWVDSMYKFNYLVALEFQETGTGAGNYSVYFNLSSVNDYDPLNITFAQLRDMIIENGNNVIARYVTANGTANVQYVTTSTNASDPTILVQYADTNYFEFYAFSELTSITITDF